MANSTWDAHAIPDQAGKTAIVTGATSGIGMETARVLAAKNANVVLAVRDVAKGERVADEMRRSNRGANLSVRALDLASLKSAKEFADALLQAQSKLDLLIENAGIMFPPYGKTKDGFELQFGTNHLGHFALAAHLLPLLQATAGSRLVVVSSLAHWRGKLDFSDLNWERRKYNPQQAYCDSKLANLLFVDEMVRRTKATGKAIVVTAAHPGWTRTELQRHSKAFRVLNPIFSQGIEMGALPTLRAACDPDAKPGDYFGPSGAFEMRGPPVKVRSSAQSHDPGLAETLWKISEELVGAR